MCGIRPDIEKLQFSIRNLQHLKGERQFCHHLAKAKVESEKVEPRFSKGYCGIVPHFKPKLAAIATDSHGIWAHKSLSQQPL